MVVCIVICSIPKLYMFFSSFDEFKAIYNYSNEADVLEFSDTLFKILKGKGNKVRQKITPRNIEKVWTIWSNHFGEYVKNDNDKIYGGTICG